MRTQVAWLFAAITIGGTALDATEAAAQNAAYFDQGWTNDDRRFFYRTSQGSRLMPYQQLLKLEQASSTERFMSAQNLTRLGFLFDADTAGNPDGLPIGMVKDADLWKGDSVGFTCAACHTRDVAVPSAQGAPVRYRVDGGQGYVDIERFLTQLEGALNATLYDQAKLNRLYAALGVTTQAAKDKVRSSLSATSSALQVERVSTAPRNSFASDPGPGRLDALAHIKNHVANMVYPMNYVMADNRIDATAPASIPQLWDAPFQTHAQWSGTVSNKGLGSLGRNLGEVTGAFAETSVSRTLGVFSANSSARITNLVDLENKVIKLKSPLWPSGLAPVNQALANQGKALYDASCASCHGVLDRAPRTKWIEVYAYGADYLRTDPNQADNSVGVALTDNNGNVIRRVPADSALAGITAGSYGSTAANTPVNPVQILNDVLAPQLVSEILRIPFLDASHKQSGAPAKAPGERLPGEPEGHTYKARPLNGIWATGPFLHNGSVRSLYELLLPEGQRARTFCAGSIELDTRDVGMKNDCAAPGSYTFDASQSGNRATGHEYGTGYSESQRRALVEYLKTL